jgi:hypothetical protein
MNIDSEILKTVGQVAGIGGIAIGALILVFREIIRKNIFPNLIRQQAYRLLVLMVVFVWTVAIAGLVAWTYVKVNESRRSSAGDTNPVQTEDHQVEGLVRDEMGNGIASADISLLGRPEKTQTTQHGTFQLRVRMKTGDSMGLQISKKGYEQRIEYVQIPTTPLTIQLKAQRAPSPKTKPKTNGKPIIIDERVSTPSPNKT